MVARHFRDCEERLFHFDAIGMLYALYNMLVLYFMRYACFILYAIRLFYALYEKSVLYEGLGSGIYIEGSVFVKSLLS